ncbi:EAL domain-containing protein [Paenibacillus sp. LHD-117]|uniref:putative bifunctional diguanylate cyclase/phosphodiesterase n=1 Tax=Paenibacillus sp. LHD-117 TaxID=3071412 RepID=UPI0027E1F5F6|nr:EAL domain-containing protein [Paenibacillus sp. LHD-117]MDQ6418305.1 EAL domain-containing protein [Paenibacillus sp. LHD-117]
MAKDREDLPSARNQRRTLSLNEPMNLGVIGLSAMAAVWIVISFVLITDTMFRWASLTVSAALIATAIVLWLRRHPLSSFRKYHTAIVEALLRSEAVPLSVLDRNGNVLELNEAAGKMLGYQRAEMIGEPIMRMIDPGSRAVLQESLEQSLQGQTIQNNINITHRTGFPLELQVICAPMIQDHEVIGTLMISHDLSDRKRNVERIRYMAYYDDMTGLPNRTLFQMKLTESLTRAKEDDRLIGICYLDLDGFKLVNASFGREFGDMLLMQVAERLSRDLPEQNLVARMEGDEFALLLNTIESEEDLLEQSRQLLKSIEEPYELKGFPIHITASIGLVTNNNEQDDGYTLFKKADMALFKAKENGKNDCLLYSDSWSNSSFERLKLQHEMYRAIQRNEFVLHYQPQYDLANGVMVGVEALVRWKHPVRGLLSPGSFIPLAEESGMIVQIGDWVLEEACRQNKAWQEAGLSKIPVSVNLSIRQFLQHDLASRVAEVLQKTGLEAKYLDLEITESMTIDVGHISRCLLAITDLGVGISVDDFGTGYSSFHYLKNFPIDRLKIDRSFVRDIQQDPSDAEIVAAIIAMAHNLNIQVIAEGVETVEQMEFLRKHRCDEMQGFFWSPPVTSENIEQMLKAG